MPTLKSSSICFSPLSLPRVLSGMVRFAHQLFKEIVIIPKALWSNGRFEKSWRLAPVFLIALIASGCDRSDAPAVNSNQADTAIDESNQADTAIDQSNDLVSEAQATVFAKELVTAYVASNRRAIAHLFAFPEIVERAIEPFGLDGTDKDDLMADAVQAAPKYLAPISSVMKAGGAYQLVHVKQRDDGSFALFRLLSVDGTYNYHLLRIRKIRGQIRADQFFNASEGDELSETIRADIAGQAEHLMSSKQITDAQKRLLEDLKIQKQMRDAVGFEFEEEALKIYNQLPARLQMSRLPMLYRIRAIPDTDQATYLAAVKEFLAKFPNDPAIGFIALDAAAVSQDVDLLQRGHKILREWTGGDPYLDLLVGTSLAALGQAELAKKITESVDPSNIDVPAGHTYKLSIASANGDHEEVLKQLGLLRDRYKINFQDLDKIEQFKSFVKSPQYEQWKNDQGNVRE